MNQSQDAAPHPTGATPELQDLLARRAERLAQPIEAVSLDPDLLLRFRSGSTTIGVDLRAVHAVHHTPVVAPLPGRSDPRWTGLVALRGTITPVVDLAHLIGDRAAAATDDDGAFVVVVVDPVRGGVGFLASELELQDRPDDASLHQPPENAPAGVLGITEDLVVIIDITTVLAHLADPAGTETP